MTIINILEILAACFAIAIVICAPMLGAMAAEKSALKKYREAIRCPHCKGTGVKL